MKKGRLQAKDIQDIDVLRFIGTHDKDQTSRDGKKWVLVYDFEEDPVFAQYGRKLLLAKCASMIRRGLIDGCACGCRGDFEMTTLGEEKLRTSAS